jgi:hypothetical protein
MIDDDSWVYDSEGGKHALFSSTSIKWQGKLLRVKRNTLVDRSNSSPDTIQASCEYLRRIVHPLLEPYFDVPEVVRSYRHALQKRFLIGPFKARNCPYRGQSCGQGSTRRSAVTIGLSLRHCLGITSKLWGMKIHAGALKSNQREDTSLSLPLSTHFTVLSTKEQGFGYNNSC